MKTITRTLILALVCCMASVLRAQDIDTCVSSINCSGVVYGLSHEQIAAYAGPPVQQLTPDAGLMYDRSYRQATGDLQIYDAPGGTLLSTIPAGFNFFTVLSATEDGWVEINRGEWVRAESLIDTTHVISHFTGVTLQGAPEYPIAWLLVNLYPSQAPGGTPYQGYDLMYRYTMVSIFDSVTVDGFDWYQIGPEQWIHQYDVARVTPIARPEGIDTERWIAINLYEEVVIAYEGDTPVFATLTATGLPRWPTLEGLFHIYFRRPRHDMSWGTPGNDFYYLEEVPWTMFFDEGRALHGAYWHDGFGFRRSHGCVNLSITDAYWLYHWVAEDFGGSLVSADVEQGPAVYVYSSGTYIQ